MEQEKVHPGVGDEIAVIDGVAVLRCAAGGPLLDGEQAALDLVGDALGRADLVVVPVARVAPAFFVVSVLRIIRDSRSVRSACAFCPAFDER